MLRKATQAGTFIVLCGLLFGASSAIAQSSSAMVIGDSFAKAYPLMANGQFAGCTLEFGKIAQDATSGDARSLYLTGNIGVIKSGVLTLKVVTGYPVSTEITPTSPILPKVPKTARLFSAAVTFADEDRRLITASDTPGGLYQVYNLSPSTFAVIEDIVARHQLQLALNFGQTSDVVVQIDLMRASNELGQKYDGRPNDAVLQFVECTKRMGG